MTQEKTHAVKKMTSENTISYLCPYSEVVLLNFFVPHSTEIPQAQFITTIHLDKHCFY